MGEAKIIITPDADEDIREIYDYLSEYSVAFVGAYRVAYYIASDEQIDILRIHHSARPPEFE